MPAQDQVLPKRKVARKRKPHRGPVSTAPMAADQVDRNAEQVQPPTPAQKTRLYAHPRRAHPRAAMRQEAHREQKAQQHRAAVKRAVKRIHVTPHPSPDATDSTRSPAQKAHDAAAAATSVRESRVKALRQTGRGTGTRAVKAELEGHGKIAAFLDSIGTKAVEGNAGHYGGPGFATIQAHSATSSLPGKIVHDVINLPAQVVPSLYVPVAGGYEAAKGRPQRLKKFASNIDKTDPVYNLGAAAVDAVGGDSKGAKGRLKAAKQAASEHPGFAAAEVIGVKGAIGRGAGAVMRHSPSKTARKVASTDRAARTLPGTSLREDRSYSPDVIRKGTQVAAEKVRRGAAKVARKRADSFRKDVPDHAAELDRLANWVDVPKHISEQEIQKRVDEHVDAQEAVRRQHRGDVLNETRALVKDAHGAGPLTNLVVQGIVHADVQDIKAYVRELEAEFPHLSNAGKRANKQLRKGLEAALARSEKGKVDLKGLEDVAAKYRSSQAAREADLAAREMLPEQQAAKAASIPYATRRMDAEHTNAHRVAAAEATKETVDNVRTRVKRLEDEKKDLAGRHKVTRGSDAAKEPQAVYEVNGTRFTTRADAEANGHLAGGGAVKKIALTKAEAARVGEASRVDRALTAARVELHKAEAEHAKARAVRNEPELVVRRDLPAAEKAKRIADLDQAVKAARASAKAQNASGRFRFGKANAVHLDSLANDLEAELHRVKAGKGGKVEPLSLDEIRQHMEDNGEPIPSWLSQAPNARGAHNFFQSSSRAPGIRDEARTGKATKGGTFDAHPDTLVEGASKQQGLIDAFDGFHSFLDEFGVKGKGGKIKTLHTRKQVDQALRNAIVDEHGEPRSGAVKFVAVRVNPFGGRAEQLGKMLEGTDDASLHGAEAINDAVEAALRGEGDGPWALIPEAAAKRLQEHVRVLNPGNAGKVGQKVNSIFRKTVLSTSLPWFSGNVVEGLMRAGLAGAGPRSYFTARSVLRRARELDKVKGERATARTVGGGHFGAAERQHVHLNVDAMSPGKVRALSRALGAFWRVGEGHSKVPSPAMAANLWHGYTHVVFNTVNRFVETQIQTAMLGKALHHSDLMDGPLLRASHDAVDLAAEGILDQNTAAALGRRVDDMYGKYGKWSPDMRKMVALYTPFVAWTINATMFVLRTLPRDHPVALALIASAENATDEWRQQHGLDKFIEGAAPDWMQGSIPGPGGSHFRAPGRYTPFGAWGNIGETVGGNVLPLYLSPLLALRGYDWKFDKLRDDDGNDLKEPFTEIAAGKAFLESTVPLLSLGERVLAKGPKAALLDPALGKVERSAPKTARRRSSGKSGFIVRPGSGSGGGRIVGPGTGFDSGADSGFSGGRIVR